jgi:UDP-glucose 4-epimerase
MRILITGPFGTIGARVLARLVEQGHEVTCLDLDTPANRAKAARLPSSVKVAYGDVTRQEDVTSAVRGQEAIVHLAAIIPPMSEAKPELAQKVNVEGTRHVVDAIAREVPSAVLVFPSSISVHGYSAGREPPARVGTPYDGRDHYASHKIECEELVRASQVRWVILRIGACVGPDDLEKDGGGEESIRMTFSMNPDTRIEYLHPDDAALAIEAACRTEEAVGKILFLGSGAHSQMTWREFVSTVPRAMGIGPLPVEWFGAEPFYTDWMDTEESERLLRFQHHGYPAYEAALMRRFRATRLLITPLRPLVRWAFGRKVAATKRKMAPALPSGEASGAAAGDLS